MSIFKIFDSISNTGNTEQIKIDSTQHNFYKSLADIFINVFSQKESSDKTSQPYLVGIHVHALQDGENPNRIIVFTNTQILQCSKLINYTKLC